MLRSCPPRLRLVWWIRFNRRGGLLSCCFKYSTTIARSVSSISWWWLTCFLKHKEPSADKKRIVGSSGQNSFRQIIQRTDDGKLISKGPTTCWADLWVRAWNHFGQERRIANLLTHTPFEKLCKEQIALALASVVMFVCSSSSFSFSSGWFAPPSPFLLLCFSHEIELNLLKANVGTPIEEPPLLWTRSLWVHYPQTAWFWATVPNSP